MILIYIRPISSTSDEQG